MRSTNPMIPMNKNPCFGLIVGTRSIFNPELATDGRKKILAHLNTLDYEYTIVDENETPTGCVKQYRMPANVRHCSIRSIRK